MSMSTSPTDLKPTYMWNLSVYAKVLMALDVWREARGARGAWFGVMWVIMNRVEHKRFWGHDVVSVITHKWQFSSMTVIGDPNLVEWPLEEDLTFQQIEDDQERFLRGLVPDPTHGALYYFSYPLVKAPAIWGPVIETLVIDRVHFCKPEVEA